MPEHVVRRVMAMTEAEIKHAEGIFGRAFLPDPIVGQYVMQNNEEVTARWFGCRLRQGLVIGEVYSVNDNRGYALWFPPNRWPWPDTDPINEDSGWNTLMADLKGSKTLENAQNWLDIMASFKTEAGENGAGWRLQVLAVDPPHQRQGLGRAVMQHSLQRFDARGQITHLDTESDSDVRFYELLGYEVTHEHLIENAPGLRTLRARRMERKPKKTTQ